MRRSVFVAALLMLAMATPLAQAHYFWFGEEGKFYAGGTYTGECWEFSECHGQRGVNIQDFYVCDVVSTAVATFRADGIEDYDLEAEIADIGLLNDYTSWVMCQYDADHERLDCKSSKGRDSLRMDVHENAAWVRVMFAEGYYAHLYFFMKAMHDHDR